MGDCNEITKKFLTKLEWPRPLNMKVKTGQNRSSQTFLKVNLDLAPFLMIKYHIDDVNFGLV